MSLSEHVRTLGRGPGRARSLTQDEAADAMRLMLDGAAPEAVGALLMLLRMKGETPEEIAGFTAAAQARVPQMQAAALDWPCYAAGRTRGQPWFVLSARLVADAGYPVLLHGVNAAPLRPGLAAAGIREVATAEAASDEMARSGIAYLPLEAASPGLAQLFGLRPVLGLRSCMNTVCRMLDPSRAGTSVQGVFHPSYRDLQMAASSLLGRQSLSIIKGGGGEFERHPGKTVERFALRAGQPEQMPVAPLLQDTRRLNEVDTPLDAVWSGAARDPFAEGIIIGTAALALETLGASDPYDTARRLLSARAPGLAA